MSKRRIIDNVNNVYEEKSGTISNSVKKELNRRSFLPGTLPSNNLVTGKKLDIKKVFFDDTLTCVFKEQNININLGLPIGQENTDNDLYFTYSNIIDSNNNLNIQKEDNNQLLLKNTGIFDLPNTIDFQNYSKQGNITQKSLDLFVEQKRVFEDYKPFEEDFGYFSISDNNFDKKNIDNNIDYHVKNQQQIKISLDFSSNSSENAYLVNTAIAYNEIDNSASPVDNIKYTDQINFLNSNRKAVSSNCFPTAYWNFKDKRWEYLDAKGINIASDGFVNNNGNQNYIFPANVQDNTIVSSNYDFRENVKNNLLNRPICFTPSFRPNLESSNQSISSNSSFLMQPTTSHGFPQKYNWQPHNNHLIKMSDYINENFIVEKIIIKGKLSANFEKPLKNGNFGESTSFGNFSSNYSLKQLKNSYLSSIDTLGFSFFILNQRKNSDIIHKTKVIPNSSFYTEAKKTFSTGVELDTYDKLYAESTFLNNSDIISNFTDHSVFQFENKNLDFYSIDEDTTNNIYLEKNKNKFYKLDSTDTLKANKYEQFVYKNISEWNSSNYTENLTNTSNEINIFDISSCYADGVSQTDGIRELVSFSNLLLVNSNDDTLLNNDMFENIDEIIQTSNNSVKDKEFTIKTSLKNYDFSNFVDESKYSILSNKSVDKVIIEGSLSNIELTLLFKDESKFSDTFSNFKSYLSGLSFTLSKNTGTLLNPTTREINFMFLDNPSESNWFYTVGNINIFNLNNLSSQWASSDTQTGIADFVTRGIFNFTLFTDKLSSFLFNESLSLVYKNSSNQTVNLNTIVSDLNLIKISNTLNKKSFNLQIKSIDNDTDISLSSSDSSNGLTNNNNAILTTSIVDNSQNISQSVEGEIFENNLTILEGYSDGDVNLSGINSERIVHKSKFSNKKINSYKNNINYNLYEDNATNKISNSYYLLKPEDELIFGINSYGNGDLIASYLELHDNLEITIIGKPQSKIKSEKSSESKSIRKVLNQSNRRKSNIEGISLVKNNYFSKIFNKKSIINNKKSIGNISSNKFGNWSGFVTLEETDNSTSNSNDKNKTFKNYYYDSLLPNIIDIFDKLLGKTGYHYKPNNADVNKLTFFIDDDLNSNDINDTESNKKNILFKNDWLEKYIFNNSVSGFDSYRNIENSINASISSIYSKILEPSIKISVNINKNSYYLEDTETSKATLGNYMLPFYNSLNTSLNRVPGKIENNSKYNFLKSNIQILHHNNNLDEYNISFTIQKPVNFDKWIIVIHDNNETLKTNNYPLYNKFKSYIEQGDNDYQELGDHLVSSRSIPLTLWTPGSIDDDNGFNFIQQHIHFSKEFKVFYGTNGQFGFEKDKSLIGDHSTSTRRTFYAELEYWESATLVKEWDNTNTNRPASFGGDGSGIAYSDTVYPDPNNNSGYDKTFANWNLINVANRFNTIKNTLSSSNNLDKWITIYDHGESIGSSGVTMPVTNHPVFRYQSCNISVSRYILKYADIYDEEKRSPVLEWYLKERYRFAEKESIVNTLQTYINKSYVEDNITRIQSLENEFDKFNNSNQDLILNEKIYESDVYHIENGRETKTNISVIFKYLIDNEINFPYIKILSMKSRGTLNKTKFNKKESCIFLPESGKIRIYEQNLLDIHSNTGTISKDEVPYFEIILKSDDTNKISYTNNSFTASNIGTSGYFDNENRGSELFVLKKKNVVSSNNSQLNFINTINFKENYEEWDSLEDRDRSLNNLVYCFGEDHSSLPIDYCGGFKFGVYNGYKTSPTYKFSAYNYGQFADFISYSTNTAYARKNKVNESLRIDYPVKKVFVDNYYEVISSSTITNTYNKDTYARCNYPYIEDKTSQLSQWNES